MYFKFLLVSLIALVGSVSCFPESRIVNGTSADITEFPFLVSLRMSDGSHFCGGSVITPDWILTAAHCVDGRSIDSISIQYATTVISAEGENIAKVKRIIKHEKYNPINYYENDIALLELNESLVFNFNTLAAVILPEPFYEVPQTEDVSGVLAGWGLNATGGYAQSHLKKVNLKIYSDAECSFRYNGLTTVDQICGGVNEGGKGQCTGDSGSPLLYKKFLQLGIVSWSYKPCGKAPQPGVTTKVSHYVGWIGRQTND